MRPNRRPGSAKRAPAAGVSTTASALAIIEWLGGNQCHDLDDAALAGELGRRLSLAGLPLDRLSLHFHTLHPALAGRIIAWAPDEPVEVHAAGFADAASMTLRDDLLARTMDAGECCLVRAGDPLLARWNGLRPFRGRALREIVVAPLSAAEGPIGLAVFGTSRVTGFSPLDHALLERVLPFLRTAGELRVLRRLELPLLDCFAGRPTPGRMLTGALLAHRTETTDAALMLVKFAAGVALAEETIGDAAAAIARHGGFVLSIEHDSMLAMFPQEADAACAAAMSAAEHIAAKPKNASAERQPALVLHHGTLTYGRIATPLGARLAISGGEVDHLRTLARGAADGITQSRRFAELLGETAHADRSRARARV